MSEILGYIPLCVQNGLHREGGISKWAGLFSGAMGSPADIQPLYTLVFTDTSILAVRILSSKQQIKNNATTMLFHPVKSASRYAQSFNFFRIGGGLFKDKIPQILDAVEKIKQLNIEDLMQVNGTFSINYEDITRVAMIGGDIKFSGKSNYINLLINVSDKRHAFAFDLIANDGTSVVGNEIVDGYKSMLKSIFGDKYSDMMGFRNGGKALKALFGKGPR